MTPTKQSEMMDKLYGKELAAKVYARCEGLDPEFNELVQDYVYEKFWARPGLKLIEKSLVTVISLIILNKAEQLEVHLKGFFHQGGHASDIEKLLKYFVDLKYMASVSSAAAILNKVSAEYKETSSAIAMPLSFDEGGRTKSIIDLAVHIALGDNEKTERCMRDLLVKKILSEKDMGNIMLHQIVYCGFPCAMNGYAVLQNIKNKECDCLLRAKL